MPARKRASPEISGDAGRRRSGRISSTPQKSKYFEDTEEEGQDGDIEPPRKRGRPSKHTSSVKKGNKKDEDGRAAPPRKRGRPSKRSSAAEDHTEDKSEAYIDDEGELAEENAEDDVDDEELDEDAPMKVTILPLEKMRGTGGVDYEDERVHENTVLFLRDLKANNKRSWLKSHDGEYRRALKDWQSFVETTTLSIIDVDETIPELPTKDVIFRIHRDIRFSKDPTPYKPHFSAAWSRTGRKGPYACYYIHCEPRHSFIGGGLWCPERDHLALLRESIDRHPRRWRRALDAPDFRRVFFPSVGTGDDDGLVDAFVDKNKEYALKKRPQGYEMDHRDIKLLRLKSFTVGKAIDESLLRAEDAQDQIKDIIRGLCPFVSFLNSIVRPDPGMQDNGGSDDGEEDP